MAKGNIFVSRKVMACAISILISLIGFISLKTLSVEQYPDIAPPTIFVNTSYTGADANTVMNSVIMPLEEQINGVEDMTYITSTAMSNGDAEITVYFKQGTDADMAAVNVQNRVSAAMGLMPAEVTKVGVTVSKRQTSILQIIGLESTDGKFDKDFLTNYVDINVKPRILRIQGVGCVNVFGDTYSLRIWMKPDIMASYGLTPDEVFAAVNSQNVVVATGSLGEHSESAMQFTLEYKGRLKSVQEFKDIVVRTSPEGQVLHLSDVADVELGSVSYNYASSVNGNPGVMFMIFQTAGANATQVNAEINKLLDGMKDQLPPGVRFNKIRSSDDFLFAAIHNVVETLIIAILLVILVVFFFLQDIRSTIIPSISIIVSLLGTFAIVKIAGFSLNILTLFALVLSIGTVVDDAIVVVEAVMAKLETGYKSVHNATRDALSEVSTAVISCTLVFMAVFIPVTFMPGTSGTFFTQFGVTIASSVGLSCISALTLCPALCAMLMRPTASEDGSRKGLTYYTRLAYKASYTAIYNKYIKAVARFIKRPALAWICLAVAGGLLFYFMKSMPAGLVPQEDQGCMMVDISVPAGTTLHDTQLIAEKVKEKIVEIPEMESYAQVCGYGMISGTGTNHITTVVRMKDWGERSGSEHSMDAIMARFAASCESIKEAPVITFQMPQIPGYGNSNCIDLMLENLYGGEMETFKEISDEFILELRNRPEIGFAISTYSDGYPKYKVDVDATQCDRSGVLPSDVLNALGAYCGGAYIGNYNQYGKVYRVMASASPEFRLSPQDLANIYIRVGEKMAPISQFVTLTRTAGSDSQKRFNLFQSINCQIAPAPGYTQGDAQKAIKEAAKKVLPIGYSYEYGGMSRELEENANSNMTGVIYLISIFLIYLILSCLYESWFIPLAVLLSVPFGLMGSFLFSDLLGLDNNIYLQTGVIMLIGLLAKTAILITEFAVEKHKNGMPVTEAALGACKDRLRPILMTVLTMIVGMIPLIIEGGAGANGNRSLAIGVVGGMSIGTIALLFVVPVFYIIFQNLHDKFHKTDIAENEK